MTGTSQHALADCKAGAPTNLISAKQPFAELRPQSLRFRTPLYHPDFPFVILWSQKAACTTVVKWFFLQIGLLDEALAYHPWIHKYEGDVFKKRPGYLDELHGALGANTPVIKFVRDPYTRAYSSFLSVCSDQALASDGHWAVSTRRQIVRDLVGNESALEYAFSFRQFLEWLAGQGQCTVNPHIRLQHVPRDEHLDIRFLKIESLSDTFRMLEEKFGLPHSVADHPDILDSGHFHKKASFDHRTARMLLDLGVPVQRSKGFPYVNFDRTLAEGTEFTALVRRCFERDLELYDYLGPFDKKDERGMGDLRYARSDERELVERVAEIAVRSGRDFL